ncbi:hypothetical protein CAPTEDRAFT_193530 [Capitella teleta]|uniref:Uncharacterized protein n=1 Tax=Capitella teleta TaxID=283909 RepID=R7UEF6_CAPTE|nr:hypothetical protein CAPTEDRAFT_193530 [Capitella teleta]|eukprot:ELU04359.1 hypothetical protein CAPTEDRAFT_193530 [Capitella teleta]
MSATRRPCVGNRRLQFESANVYLPHVCSALVINTRLNLISSTAGNSVIDEIKTGSLEGGCAALKSQFLRYMIIVFGLIESNRCDHQKHLDAFAFNDSRPSTASGNRPSSDGGDTELDEDGDNYDCGLETFFGDSRETSRSSPRVSQC